MSGAGPNDGLGNAGRAPCQPQQCPQPAPAALLEPGPWLHGSLCWMGNSGPGQELCPDLPLSCPCRHCFLESACEVDQESPGGSLSPASCKPPIGFNPKWLMATLLHLPSHIHKMCPSPPNKPSHHGSQVPQLPRASDKGWESSAYIPHLAGGDLANKTPDEIW